MKFLIFEIMIILFYLFFDLNHDRPAWIFFFLKLYVKTKLGRKFKRNRYLGDVLFFLFCLGDLAVGKFGPHPVGGYGCQGGQSFKVGGKGS